MDLQKWLDTPCDTTDLLQLEKDVWYMPIGFVKKKIKYMEDNFSVFVLETNFQHQFFSINNKEYYSSGSIEITILDKEQRIFAKFVGAATFPISNYAPNLHFAATLESLCIVNAFGGKYPQFGSVLNKVDVVPEAAKQKKPPAPDTSKEMEQVFKMLKRKLGRYKNREDAQAYLDTTEYKNNLEAKAIVNLLPLKNN